MTSNIMTSNIMTSNIMTSNMMTSNMMTSVKDARHIQKVFIASLNVFRLLSMCAKFQVNK